MNICFLTAHELRDAVSSGRVSVDEITGALRERIAAVDPVIRAFVPNGIALPAPGLGSACPAPIAIKDNICVNGWPTTCSSRVLEGFVAPYDATVIRRLKEAGVPLIGHTNMDEFAFGSSTETSFYGPTRNPWETTCVPGGSSGGSAAAVGAGEAVWALGSDTGGSIRQPAAFCGVVGLKPTYGRVSRYGLIAFASSLDQIGPLTRDVEDAALLMNIIAGYDPKDATSADVPVPDYKASLGEDCRGLRIGVPREYFIDGLDPEVRATVEEAIAVFKARGAVIIEVSLPHTVYAVSTYYIVATAEASSNLARFDGVQYGLRAESRSRVKGAIVDMIEETRDQGFGREVKRRVMLGTYVLSSGYYDAYYLRAQKVRTLIKNDFDRVFADCDALVTPTTPTPAFRIGEKTTDPVSMYLSDIYTISANLSGVPAISVPCGRSADGRPIGLQILGKPFDEPMLFRLASAYERQTEWHRMRPEIMGL